MSIHNSSALARQANWYWTNINCLLSANAMTTVLPAIIRNAIGRDLLSRRETESSVAYANPFSHACRANNGSTQYRTGGHGLFRVIRRDVKVLMVSVSKALVSLASLVIRHLGCNYIVNLHYFEKRMRKAGDLLQNVRLTTISLLYSFFRGH